MQLNTAEDVETAVSDLAAGHLLAVGFYKWPAGEGHPQIGLEGDFTAHLLRRIAEVLEAAEAANIRPLS